MSKKGEKCYGKTHNRCTVQNGFMTQVLGNDPENTEVDVIDLDTTTEGAEKFAEYCLEEAKKELQVIY